MTPAGRLYCRVREETIRGPQVVAFLYHLLRHIRRRPIMVLWDSGPHHRAKVVQNFLKEHPRLEVYRFPGYSPELNPDEWVWSHLKNHELASFAPHNVRELRRVVRLGVMGMCDRPRLIRSFVRAAHLYDAPTERGLGHTQGELSGASVNLFCPVSVITHENPDQQHLAPMMWEMAGTLGTLPIKVLADAGYFSAAQIRQLQARDIAVFRPPESWRVAESAPFKRGRPPLDERFIVMMQRKVRSRR